MEKVEVELKEFEQRLTSEITEIKNTMATKEELKELEARIVEFEKKMATKEELKDVEERLKNEIYLTEQNSSLKLTSLETPSTPCSSG